MKTLIASICGFALILSFAEGWSQESRNKLSTPTRGIVQSSSQTKPTTAQDPDRGERKFQENCSRCHTAPEQLSPRIAGTVLRHMRVRASLSAEDERDILRYLAP